MKAYLLIVITFVQVYITADACTIFMGISNGKVLVGNNEDFIDPNTFVWFLPEEKNKYGRVYFGFNTELPQGGMNERGLFFDCAAVPARIGKHFNKKTTYKGNLMKLAIETCSNIEEVITLFKKYERSFMTYQILFADKNGNSVIIESDTMIAKEKEYQIATNFYQSLSLSKISDYSALQRYQIADSLLSTNNNYTVDYFRTILDKTHQEGFSPTQYSNIYDLSNGDIYVYLFHDYHDVCKLNLFEELKKGRHSHRISILLKGSKEYKNFSADYHAIIHKAIKIDTSLYNKYVGEYSNNNFPPAKYYITKQNGKLFMMIEGLDSYPLEPVSEDELFMKELNMTVKFNYKQNQVADKILISIYGIMNFDAIRIKQ